MHFDWLAKDLPWTRLERQCQDRLTLCKSGIAMELDWLKDFLALAERGSFSRGADHRNVTQPAFSRRVRALEAWIGTALFVRGTQGATLTPAGAHFRPFAEDMLRQLERTRRDTAAIGGHQSKSISIAATHALSFTFFPDWIRRHSSLEELGTLSLISDTLEACEALMQSGEVQFLLCHHHAAAPVRLASERFSSVHVGGDILVPVSAPDHAGRAACPIPSTSSQPTRFLAYSAASGLGRILLADRRCSAAMSKLDTVFTSHLAATLMTVVRAGDGAAWLPLTMVEDDLSTGRLVRAGARELEIPVEIRLYRPNDERSDAARKLWQLLLDGEAVTGPDRTG